MPADAKVWVYASDRLLSSDEKAAILHKATQFTSGWTAHEQPLKAAVDILHDAFIVFMVDPTHNEVSGCGIDKSVAFMKALGTGFNIDFFNRLQLEFLTKEGMRVVSRSKARELEAEGKIGPDTLTFDKTVNTKEAFDARFSIPFHQSWAWQKKPVNA